MIVKCFDTQFGTVQCAVSLFDSATVVARPALNESSQLGSSTILECRVVLVRNSNQNTMADGDGTPPRSKTPKRIRYEQKFKPEYCSEFKFLSKSRAGETYAFCTLCRSDICIVHGRRGDKKHAGTANRLVICFVSTRCLAYYFLLFFGPKPYYCVFSNVGRSGTAITRIEHTTVPTFCQPSYQANELGPWFCL